MRIFLASVLCVLSLGAFDANAAYDSAKANAQKDLRIIRVTPSGDDVAATKQIVITFNRDVVPLGRMERSKDEVPVDISPAVECEWRWINPSSLACQLGDKTALTEATKYTVTVNKGIKAEDGADIAKPYTGTFITKRPDVSYASFATWRGPGTPVIRLTFNQPVTQASVKQHIIAVNGNHEIRLKVRPDPNDRQAPEVVAFDKGWLFFGKQDSRKVDDQPTATDNGDARRVWLVEPVRELPLDSNVALKLEPGLVSATGPERSIAKRNIVTFDTYPELAVVGIRCRTNADEDVLLTLQNNADKLCNPMAPISIAFSAPVKRSNVRDGVTFTPSLGSPAAKTDVWGDLTYEYSYLSQPHTKGRTYDVNLPYGLKAAQEYSVCWLGC